MRISPLFKAMIGASFDSFSKACLAIPLNKKCLDNLNAKKFYSHEVYSLLFPIMLDYSNIFMLFCEKLAWQLISCKD